MNFSLTTLQNFWDPVTNEEFHYNREESTWVSRWWHGEPVRVLNPWRAELASNMSWV